MVKVIVTDTQLQVDGPVFQNKSLGLQAFEWIDPDSGINKYNFEIFEMTKRDSDLLTESSKPLEVISFSSSVGKFGSYNLTNPGMYSVVLKVSDNSNNVAYARSLVLYDNSSSVSITEHPLRLANANPDTGYKWLTSKINDLQFQWIGHFENSLHKRKGFLDAVKKWTTDYGVDDTTGNRTTEAIPHKNGIVKFETSSGVHNSIDEAVNEPKSWNLEPDLKESKTMSVSVNDGQTIAFRVRATDVMGNSKSDFTLVFCDASPPFILDIGHSLHDLTVKSSESIRLET